MRKNITFTHRYFQQIIDTKTREIQRLDNRLRNLQSQLLPANNHPDLTRSILRLERERDDLQRDRLRYLYRIGQ